MFRSCLLPLAISVLIALPLDAQTPKPPAQPPRPARPAAPRPTQRRPLPPAPQATPAAPEPPKPAPPDLQLTATHATGATSTTSTVVMKGARTRISLGENLASIQQCDAGQTVQLNTATRTYLAVPFQPPTAVAPPSAPDPKRKGGEVIYTTTVTDTGETQPMFGFTARHLKLVVVKESSITACDTNLQKVETDGWFIDLPSTVSCATAPPRERTLQPDPEHPDCVDEVRYEPVKTPVGYPVKYTSIATTGDEPPVTTTMEVTRLERTSVESSVVEVPADYVAVRSVTQLTADHRPGEPGVKRPGVLRVGLAPLADKSTTKLGVGVLSEALLESFTETELDIVRLSGASPAELEADAKSKEVDLILQSTITEVKTPRGGVIGRISGTSGDAFTARVDFALVVPGQVKPTYSANERSGGSTLNSAINIARKAVQFAPPAMMAKYGYMNAYGSMLSQNGPSGAMKQSPDPVMNMAFSMLDKAAAKTASEQFSTEEAAVAAALEKEVKAVVAEMSKKKK